MWSDVCVQCSLLVVVSITSSYQYENIVPAVEGTIAVWGFAALGPGGKFTSQLVSNRVTSHCIVQLVSVQAPVD